MYSKTLQVKQLGPIADSAALLGSYPAASYPGAHALTGTNPYDTWVSDGTTWFNSTNGIYNTNPWSLLTNGIDRLWRVKLIGSSSDIGNRTALPTLPWMGSTLYAAGAVRSNSGKVYLAKVGGTSASSGGPTTTSQLITDGSVTWRYLGDDPKAWKANISYTRAGEFCSNLGNIYVVVTPGVSASSGGPTANSTSITDNTVTWCRVQQVWVDTVYGLDANTGLNPSQALKTFPNAASLSTASSSCNDNTLYWVAAGSEITVDFTSTIAIGLALTVSRCGVTVYNRLNGNEIKDQPNPFERALQGKWVTDVEKASKYFKITGNAGAGIPADAFPSTNGKGIYCSAAGSTAMIRGAYITGCPYGGLVFGSTGTITSEDCILENNSQLGTATDDGADGCGARLEGTSVGSVLRRMFIRDSGEDGIWSASDPGATDYVIEDIAIHHRPKSSFINSNHHSDGIQLGMYPGAAVIQRVVIEHDLTNAIFSNSQAIGAGLIIDSTGTSGTNTSTINDVVIVSNNQCLNTQTSCSSINRGLFVAVKEADGTSDRTFVHAFQTTQTLNDCVSGTVGAFSSGEPIYYGAAPTLNSSSTFSE